MVSRRFRQRNTEIQTQIDRATQTWLTGICTGKIPVYWWQKNSSSFKKMQYDIEELENEIKYAKAELAELEASGGAFTWIKEQEAAASMRTLQAEEKACGHE